MIQKPFAIRVARGAANTMWRTRSCVPRRDSSRHLPEFRLVESAGTRPRSVRSSATAAGGPDRFGEESRVAFCESNEQTGPQWQVDRVELAVHPNERFALKALPTLHLRRRRREESRRGTHECVRHVKLARHAAASQAASVPQ